MNEELEIPDRIIRNATLLEQAGIFNYGNCSTCIIYLTFNCFLDNAGPNYCRNNPITSCWNGTHSVERFRGINFTITSIEGQSKSNKPGYKNIVIDLNYLVNNPYYNVTLSDIQNEVNQLGKFNCSTYY